MSGGERSVVLRRERFNYFWRKRLRDYKKFWYYEMLDNFYGLNIIYNIWYYGGNFGFFKDVVKVIVL